MKHDSGRRLPRFLMEHCSTPGQVLELPETLMHYASRVLRLREGESLRIWNGVSAEYLASIHYISKKIAQVQVGEQLALPDTELNRPVHVLQALPEGDKMDWILEKCTELGVACFHPVQASRSVVKLDSDRAVKRQLHWERVVLAASLQSERNRLPTVQPVRSLQDSLDFLNTAAPDASLLWFTPRAEYRMVDWAAQAEGIKPLVICVGPEGGWTPEETEMATRRGAQALNFSQRVLRTETFATACTAQLTALLKLETH
ncbi:MAG TPA: 16S rRNA (uracil(1498)-N(3))-methyltransferase [Limnobacter sp.]|nr:16S rRNA (uracil(1498)-N(3))-methyltransferase [Limnobacter sp.]